MPKVYRRKSSLSLKRKQVLYKQCFPSLEMCSVLHPCGWSLPDIWSRSHLHVGSDHPVLPDAARTSQQRHLLDPSDRVTLVLVKHREQYPLLCCEAAFTADSVCTYMNFTYQQGKLGHRRPVLFTYTACTTLSVHSLGTSGRRKPSG